jgi:glycosyltransferase involved in cell wall biosynthesis
MVHKGLVSVIIPTFNRAERCKRAVESVVNQSYANLEILVIDDGSTDNTKEVIDGIDERLRYIYQENAGVSAARNTGIKNTKGEFIAFLDSDDIWLPWKLELQINLLNSDKNIGMIWSEMSAVDDKGEQLYEKYLEKMYTSYKYFDRDRYFDVINEVGDYWHSCPKWLENLKVYTGYIYPWMFMGNLVHTSTVVMRKTRVETVGYFNEDLKKSGEDYEYHFRTCKKGIVAYVDVPTIQYCIGAPDQLTTYDNWIWMAKNDVKTLEAELDNVQIKNTLGDSLVRRRMGEAYEAVGVLDIFRDKNNARANLIKSIKWYKYTPRVYGYLMLSFLPKGNLDRLLGIKRRLNNYLN